MPYNPEAEKMLYRKGFLCGKELKTALKEQWHDSGVREAVIIRRALTEHLRKFGKLKD